MSPESNHYFNSFRLSCSYLPPKPATIIVEGYAFDSDYLGRMWAEFRKEFLKRFDFYANFICSGTTTTIVLSLNMAPCSVGEDIDPAEYMNAATDYVISNVVDDVKLMLDRSANLFDEGHSADEVLNLVFPDRKDRLARKERAEQERAEIQERRKRRRAERKAAKAERVAKRTAKQAASSASSLLNSEAN